MPILFGPGFTVRLTGLHGVLFKQYSLLLTNFCDTMCNEQGLLGMLQGDILKDSVL